MVLPLPVMKTLEKPGPSACSRCFRASSAGSLQHGWDVEERGHHAPHPHIQDIRKVH